MASWWPWGGGWFLMSEVPLQTLRQSRRATSPLRRPQASSHHDAPPRIDWEEATPRTSSLAKFAEEKSSGFNKFKSVLFADPL